MNTIAGILIVVILAGAATFVSCCWWQEMVRIWSWADDVIDEARRRRISEFFYKREGIDMGNYVKKKTPADALAVLLSTMETYNIKFSVSDPTAADLSIVVEIDGTLIGDSPNLDSWEVQRLLSIELTRDAT